MTQFRNLVFKGGGVKGVAYIGALEALEQYGVIPDIRRVCGTSSGALVAAHIALGGRAEQLGRLLDSGFLRGLLDKTFWPGQPLPHLLTDYGWFQGKRLSLWLKRHMESLSGDPGITFGQLEGLAGRSGAACKHLAVIATNVTLQCAHIFSASTTPELPIWKALQASMSIPFLFSVARLDGEGPYVDGGLTWNYPLNFYDEARWLSQEDDARLFALVDHPSSRNASRFYNKETLGLMVETRTRDAGVAPDDSGFRRGIESFPAYIKAMIGLMTDSSSGNFLNLSDWQRTVFIEADGVRATDFNLPQESIASLQESGRRSVHAYMQWFLDQSNRPLNRVEESTA
ncbi:hypothetical protein NNJEOMEG_01757 [Fundidesulfovibrio magnetotacticus]|uniref:PNPLA domain-containing protein n=1 Tax=Fundidesulfovibrio magnetotacticus TaxID=2730080 RepID=A0A6V8LUY0_9BACT|nr:patatin-like phospholipase family protein [Fundidesulfovibrio magnetotacticus]GFK93919.1 hypothetical protein NNJEOMEG_01757 [Fundidesulfovibrio magnetotacticus]